jgi:hypothetical protein
MNFPSPASHNCTTIISSNSHLGYNGWERIHGTSSRDSLIFCGIILLSIHLLRSRKVSGENNTIVGLLCRISRQRALRKLRFRKFSATIITQMSLQVLYQMHQGCVVISPPPYHWYTSWLPTNNVNISIAHTSFKYTVSVWMLIESTSLIGRKINFFSRDNSFLGTVLIEVCIVVYTSFHKAGYTLAHSAVT